ncbi:MAG: cofactor-independent phosphoglycerate mutase [Methanomethylovorans sp.]|nr:cofactor-independent phosphoglycerate mutase [Methanomethylovorans sp.]
MKYVILIGDGMADEPLDELGGKTILQKAKTPNMDYIAANGRTGLAQTVPEGMHPGSDVANMSIIGYDPKKYYSGRAPLEAASMGINLNSDDVAFRCNLITINDGIIVDYSAGHISSEEAKVLIQNINAELGKNGISFYPGISYRHLLVTKNKLGSETECTPPHDIIGENMDKYLPKGKDSKTLCELISSSMQILEKHPINIKRILAGKKPANSIWLWGQGGAPEFPLFKDLYGKTGAIISAVDLVKGIGLYAGFDVIDVPGATGYLDTNYRGKAEYALEALKDHDFVVVHVEAPDEAGHMGDLKAKMQAVEDFDEMVVGTILQGAKNLAEDITILLMPDHPTPVHLRTHTSTPIPFAIYSTTVQKPDKAVAFNEVDVKAGSFGTVYAADLVKIMLYSYS